MKRTLKTVYSRSKKITRESAVNRYSKILDISISLFRCYEYKSSDICNTTVYVSHCVLSIISKCTIFNKHIIKNQYSNIQPSFIDKYTVFPGFAGNLLTKKLTKHRKSKIT